jgi:hypothetical protein
VPDHPYRHAEDRAFWSRSVAAGFNPGAVPEPAAFTLDRADRFMSAGSCFAANVRRYLEAWGFHYVVAEGHHPNWPESAESAYYEAYSARYGNVYTARQMVQLLRRATGAFSPQEDHWVDPDGRFVDPFRPGLKFRAYSLPELRALTAQHLRAVKRVVETSTVFVFTLGLTEAWVSTVDGAVFPACPGTIAGEFDPDRHKFVNFSCDEVTADLELMIALLRTINPALRVIVTVSPVPLVATASGRHVLAATSYSKSVLRVAADQVVRRQTDVAYFPAFEMVLRPQRSSSPFAEDLRTVREPVVAEVMSGFRAAYIHDAPEVVEVDRAEAREELSSAVAAAVADDCEEMFADERIWRPDTTVTRRDRRRPLDIESLHLSAGSHADGEDEFCVMEAASYVGGEDWSDVPSSVSPVIAALLRTLNDAMDDGDRQLLRHLISMLPGTRGDDELEAARSWIVMDWHCRRWPSIWLRWAGHLEEADALTWVAEITDSARLRAAVPALGRARAAAATMRVATTHASLEEGLDAAIAAAQANPAEAAIVAARAAIQSDGGGFAMRAAQKQVPAAAHWTAKRRGRWGDACNAAAYGMSVAAGTSQIAAVRALAATSAWSAGWDTARNLDPETWDRARDDARSIGRDAALVLAWRSAWAVAASADPRRAWTAGASSAAEAIREPVGELHRSVVGLVRGLVERNLDVAELVGAYAAG